jgi:hypothetical protein
MTTVRFSRLARGRGGLVTVVTVVALLVGIGATIFGLGAANNAIANYDASSWLWSNNKGEVARVNGVTGRVDTRYKVSDALGHTVQVTQTDRYVILRDLNTGKVSVLDLASLQLAASTRTTAGLGVTVALHGDAAFVIDSVQGIVTQLEPSTLGVIGQPLRFMPGLSGGTFDADGRLWLLVPGEGTVVAIQPTPPGAKPRAGGGTGGSAAGNPKIVRTESVGEPSHDLVISVLDKGVAVLDKTAATLTTFAGERTKKISLALSGPGTVAARTNGGDVPVTVTDDRNVYVVTGDKVAQFRVPGDSPKLKACVAWSSRFYCADEATGTVYVLDGTGRLANTIAVPGSSGGPLELEVREDHLFINAPTTSSAEVVDGKGRVKLVDKYANNVLGGDPPPPVPPPPPQKPPVSAPGAPGNVRATAGNAAARVTWGQAPANGAAIMKYVVEGDGKTHEVGAEQRSLAVPGLTNGKQYTFTVYAVNAKGSGPKRAANPVVPTADVPDPPTSITATENKDGTVTVTWPAANGGGRPIAAYQVTSVPAAPQDPFFTSTAPTLTIPASRLTYGTQYAFTATAVNDRGANSKPSPLSNTVVPYTVPGAPTGVKPVAVSNEAGAITVTWNAPAENGRPITKYVVTGAGKTQEVTNGTSAKLTGLGNGTSVQVQVHAVNAAGNGANGVGTTSTIDKPQPPAAIGNPGATGTSITFRFTVNSAGASPAATKCTVTVNNGAHDGPCDGVTVGGLYASSTYSYTVTATNPAGTSAPSSGSAATSDISGTAHCEPPPGSTGDELTWCKAVNPGNALEVQTNPANLHNTQVAKTTSGQTYAAHCYTTGDDVDAYIYNSKKKSNIWVSIRWNNSAAKQYYTPLTWLNINGGTGSSDVGGLPHC